MLEWGFDPALQDDAALVTTELAANAVVHAGSKFSVVLRAERDAVRLCVHDDGPFEGAKLIVRQGRGLGLLSELSHRWGMDPSGRGKVVWAELRPTPRASSS